MSIPVASHTLKLNKKEEEAKGREKIVSKYKDRRLSLPKSKGWITDYLYNYQGFWYMNTEGATVEGVMATQDGFEVRPNDIILATNPKCGTTWLKALAFAIVTRTSYKVDSTHPLMVGNPHDYVPFIEFQLIYRTNPVPYDVEITDPQLLATHMPYVSLPPSFHTSGCRVVYICREAKDMFISFWFFFKKMAKTGAPHIAFEEAFDLFCKGVSFAGPYWDHVLGYYKASLEHPDKVLFLKYEEMKRDPVSNVKRLAEFLGRPFTVDEEMQGVVEDIIQLCSFENLKSLEVNKTGVDSKTFTNVTNDVFFREGKVGDSMTHLTPEMIRSIDQITKQKFHGYDLSF